jgi:hypothetical protein
MTMNGLDVLKLSLLYSLGESLPFRGREKKHRPKPILGITDRNMPLDERDLNTAATTAIRALLPHRRSEIHTLLLSSLGMTG